MPRSARRVSESGIYHVILRGINRQAIFEDREDSEKFLEILEGYKAISGFEVFAYCLMGNHVHLLIRIGNEPLSMVFRRISSKYVYWFNAKYDRIGHLFQERFKSEPVEDDTYLLASLRYIHNNPVRAGICEKPEDYPFSSYRDYLGSSGLTDTEFALSVMPLAQMIEFTNAANEDKCLEVPDKTRARFTDEDAREIIREMTGCLSVADFQSLDDNDKKNYMCEMLGVGLSINQLSRLTGMTVGRIRGCKNRAKRVSRPI